MKNNKSVSQKTTMSDMASYCGVSRQVVSAVLYLRNK